MICQKAHHSTLYDYRIFFFRIEYSLLQKSLVLFWISLFHIYYRLQEANNSVKFFYISGSNAKKWVHRPRAHFKSKIFIFCPSHSHTPTLSIVIERRYVSSHHKRGRTFWAYCQVFICQVFIKKKSLYTNFCVGVEGLPI